MKKYVTKKIVAAHLYPSPFTNESRMLREFDTLRKYKVVDRVIVVAAREKGLQDYEEMSDAFIHVYRFSKGYSKPNCSILLKLIGFIVWSLKVITFLNSKQDIGIVQCHSFSVLPIGIAYKLKAGIRVIYDAHELESEKAGNGIFRRVLYRQIERVLLKKVDEVWVVSDAIKNWYKSVQRVDTKVVYNYPYSSSRFSKTTNRVDLRKIFNISKTPLLFLYQGVLCKGRGVERIIQWFRRVNPKDAHVVFLGDGPIGNVVKIAADRYDNIHFHKAVPPNNLMNYTATADVGLSFIEPVSLSYRYCLPNKLFEYLHAGIGIWASDLPEMRKVIREVRNGILLDPNIETAEAANLIKSTTIEEVANWKEASRRLRYKYTWEREEKKVINAYNKYM